jgi:hypothetical protein
MNFKYGIGVMSKNVVDVCIDYANKYNHNIILIPSRRQVDYCSGYVNNWNTETLSSYVKSKTSNILLKRDHGGPHQGNEKDAGFLSLYHDCLYFDAIHIDPWKVAKHLDEGCELTKRYIEFCYSKNPNVIFEVGTEESIFRYDAHNLDYLLSNLKDSLKPKIFESIKYAVIQSGTCLKENTNTGDYDVNRLTDMINVCKKYGMFSKEHNGDYLSDDLITDKFKVGLDSINLAPELGQIETQVYLNQIKNTNLFDIYFDLCYASRRWEKWVDYSTFDPFKNREKLINICGHYVLSQKEFVSEIKNKITPNIDYLIKESLTRKLDGLYGEDMYS